MDVPTPAHAESPEPTRAHLRRMMTGLRSIHDPAARVRAATALEAELADGVERAREVGAAAHRELGTDAAEPTPATSRAPWA